jgi:zinc finger HIT domain-containing protein 1
MSDRQKRARTRKSLSTTTPATESTETGNDEEAAAAPKPKQEKETGIADGDAMEIDTPAVAIAEPPPVKGLIKTSYDNDPLLKSHLPRPPSDRLMAVLLAEPPLTYNAARARPSASGKPARYFCTICGYWGKIKCRNCGVRTCGLDCYKVHEDSRCGAFF